MDIASQLLLLTCLYSCWKWSTKLLFEGMVASMGELLSAQPLAPAAILQHVCDRMESEMRV